MKVLWQSGIDRPDGVVCRCFVRPAVALAKGAKRVFALFMLLGSFGQNEELRVQRFRGELGRTAQRFKFSFLHPSLTTGSHELVSTAQDFI